MKTWMKVLLWAGTGFGFGFFIGLQVGQRNADKAFENGRKYEQDQLEEDYIRNEREAIQAVDEYAGDTSDDLPFGDMSEFEDAEMPKEEDLVIDPEIPQVHPQHFVPEIISETEFEANEWAYDREYLEFYEMDEVLYNRTTQNIIEDPDGIIGIGTLFEFSPDPTSPRNDRIFVRNDTYGTLFRIDRLDEAFCDAVDGTCPPGEDEEGDDFWNDV